ncbi:MAG: hypothetical protein FJ125_14740, partial [Deltaproteobacteria bacterium]|nr:hypothetical protein [Deltaproteobacteria bacterium]
MKRITAPDLLFPLMLLALLGACTSEEDSRQGGGKTKHDQGVPDSGEGEGEGEDLGPADVLEQRDLPPGAIPCRTKDD